MDEHGLGPLISGDICLEGAHLADLLLATLDISDASVQRI